MPVKGRSRSTPAMMKKAWKPMMMVRPVAMSREKSERAAWAMRRPAPTSRMKAKTTTAVPTRPISDADGGEDHVGGELGDSAQGGILPQPGAPEAPGPQAEPAQPKLAPAHVGVGGGLPRVEPLVHPQVDLVEVAGGHVGADGEQDEARARDSRSGRW